MANNVRFAVPTENLDELVSMLAGAPPDAPIPTIFGNGIPPSPMRPAAAPNEGASNFPVMLGRLGYPKIGPPVPPPRVGSAVFPRIAPSGAPSIATPPPSVPAAAPSFGDNDVALQRPTRQESIAAGKAEFERGLPTVTAKPGTPEYYEQKQERSDYEKSHPWGSPISAHPDAYGKIGHVFGRIGGYAASALVPHVAALFPGTPLGRIAQENRNAAGLAEAQRSDVAEQEARVRQTEAETERERASQQDWRPIEGTDSEIESRSGQTRPMRGVSATKPETLSDEEGRAVEDLLETVNPQTGKNYTRPEAIREVSGDKKPLATSPFEAFAYGTPQERQDAQDFLTFEKRIGAEFRNPSELEERYSLYKRDPDAYKAMFGDRGAAQDQTNDARTQQQAARMLKYFDGRRKEVQNDFMLDDTEKQQKLSEIDQLEKPYQDAAQDEDDTIQVINPDGTVGTIPTANLKKALKKGYKLAPNQ